LLLHNPVSCSTLQINIHLMMLTVYCYQQYISRDIGTGDMFWGLSLMILMPFQAAGLPGTWRQATMHGCCLPPGKAGHLPWRDFS
jgi:hypothetical protein